MDDKEIITKAICDLPMIRSCEDNEKLESVLKWVLSEKQKQIKVKLTDWCERCDWDSDLKGQKHTKVYKMCVPLDKRDNGINEKKGEM